MSRFEVDSDAVSAASGKVQGSIGTLSSEVDLMMRHLDELQSTWRGGAANSFAVVVAEWRATQERVKESLQSIQGALALAGRQYAEVEDSTTRMFAG